jgi:hypothetical protein
VRQAWRLAGQNWGAGSAQTVPRLSKGGLHATLRCKKKTPSPPPPLLRVHQALDLPYHAPPTTAALVFSLRNAELKSHLRLRIRCRGAENSAPPGARERFFTGGTCVGTGLKSAQASLSFAAHKPIDHRYRFQKYFRFTKFTLQSGSTTPES